MCLSYRVFTYEGGDTPRREGRAVERKRKETFDTRVGRERDDVVTEGKRLRLLVRQIRPGRAFLSVTLSVPGRRRRSLSTSSRPSKSGVLVLIKRGVNNMSAVV